MTIPKYVDTLLGYQGRYRRVALIHQITNYAKYPGCIAGYLYCINLERYKYPRCFRSNIERFAKWCRRMGAEAIVHTVVENGWNTYAIVSITDPVALALEKAGYIEK